MNNTLRTITISVGVLLAGVIVLFVGFSLGRASYSPVSLFSRGAAMLTGSSWGHYNGASMGPGMMEYGLDRGMDENSLSHDHMGAGHMSSGFGMMGGGFGMTESGLANGRIAVDPLTPAEAQEAVEGYLNRLDDENLTIGEIMIFDNHAYAQIIEEDTGIGAMEVLVDPITMAVTPEHGPNMMWNLKYSPMSGHTDFGMLGMMETDGFHRQGSMMESFSGGDPDTEMTIDRDGAVAIAQDYLTANSPGTAAEDHADAFYGYYTLHILKDGEVIGMLSVNGFSGQVFPHTWHGEFVEMTGETDH